MLDIAKAILDAAKALLGLADQLNTAERQQRAEMADLFDKISACLAATSSEIRAGEIPHGRCGELMMYADSLPPLASTHSGVEMLPCAHANLIAPEQASRDAASGDS